jgi:spore germination cell wall hydrolase CwlJ-like protein
MRGFFSKIAALVVVCAISSTAHAKEVTDVSMKRQLTCLAQNIYFEAGSEPLQGKVAVAQVTINRVNSGRFPNTICGVVDQKTYIADKAVCQFSWKCDPEAKASHKHSAAWLESYRIAELVLIGGKRIKQLGEKTMYFHNTQVDPRWPLRRIARIGNHIFYTSDREARKVTYNK